MEEIYGTKNFNLTTDPKLACTCGNSKCDKRKLKMSALTKLQAIRDDFGKPLILTSGARCPLHKEEIGRKNTDHQSCLAVDIFCDNDLDRTKLIALAGRHGATKIAYSAKYKFIHICFRKTKRTDIPTWTYNGHTEDTSTIEPVELLEPITKVEEVTPVVVVEEVPTPVPEKHKVSENAKMVGVGAGTAVGVGVIDHVVLMKDSLMPFSVVPIVKYTIIGSIVCICAYKIGQVIIPKIKQRWFK